VVEITLNAAPLLGPDLRIGGNTIRERADIALVSLATPLGGDAAVAAALRAAWGLEKPTPVMSSHAGEMRALRSGADQILLAFAHATPDANAVVQAAIKGAGYSTDQTDAWVILELDGPDTLSALARLCPLDLNPAAFPPGAAARTVMEHMGAFVLHLEDGRYWLMSASSSASSFLHAVETSYRNVT